MVLVVGAAQAGGDEQGGDGADIGGGGDEAQEGGGSAGRLVGVEEVRPEADQGLPLPQVHLIPYV